MKKLMLMCAVAVSVCGFAEEKPVLTEILSAAKAVVAKDSSATDDGLASLNRQIQELTEKIKGAKSSSDAMVDEWKKKLEELKAQVKAKLEELKTKSEEKSEEDRKASEERKARIEEAKSSVSNLVDSVKNIIR